MPMRHGLTLGELGHWFINHFNLDVDYRVIEMQGWEPDAAPGFGWPTERVWINPSPNAANLNMARAYAGTVMLEGTTLSEGRGTTRALELFGAPDLEPRRIMAEMERLAPEWLAGCRLREVTFQPTFHKHAGDDVPWLVHPRRGPLLRPSGVQAVAAAVARVQGDPPPLAGLRSVARFSVRICIRQARDRRHQRLAPPSRVGRRPGGGPDDLDTLTIPDERAWHEERTDFLLY